MIKETPEDMFTFLPPKKDFMKEFRNPCWKGKDLDDEEKLFCMPYFYIIGFTKCGQFKIIEIRISAIIDLCMPSEIINEQSKFLSCRVCYLIDPGANA